MLVLEAKEKVCSIQPTDPVFKFFLIFCVTMDVSVLVLVF
jgi:hypothetical protein